MSLRNVFCIDPYENNIFEICVAENSTISGFSSLVRSKFEIPDSLKIEIFNSDGEEKLQASRMVNRIELKYDEDGSQLPWIVKWSHKKVICEDYNTKLAVAFPVEEDWNIERFTRLARSRFQIPDRLNVEIYNSDCEEKLQASRIINRIKLKYDDDGLQLPWIVKWSHKTVICSDHCTNKVYTIPVEEHWTIERFIPLVRSRFQIPDRLNVEIFDSDGRKLSFIDEIELKFDEKTKKQLPWIVKWSHKSVICSDHCTNKVYTIPVEENLTIEDLIPLVVSYLSLPSAKDVKIYDSDGKVSLKGETRIEEIALKHDGTTNKVLPLIVKWSKKREYLDNMVDGLVHKKQKPLNLEGPINGRRLLFKDRESSTKELVNCMQERFVNWQNGETDKQFYPIPFLAEGPGVGKSRYLNELSEMLKNIKTDNEELNEYLFEPTFINVTFNSDFTYLTGEIKDGIEQSLCTRILYQFNGEKTFKEFYKNCDEDFTLCEILNPLREANVKCVVLCIDEVGKIEELSENRFKDLFKLIIASNPKASDGLFFVSLCAGTIIEKIRTTVLRTSLSADFTSSATN